VVTHPFERHAADRSATRFTLYRERMQTTAVASFQPAAGVQFAAKSLQPGSVVETGAF